MKQHEVLRKYRELRGMTQKDIAEMLNMTHSGYSKYERGERKITIEILFELIRLLKIPTSAFGNDDEFIENDYWITYEQELYEIAKDFKDNKNNYSLKQIQSTRELFTEAYKRIELEKNKLTTLLKPKKLEEVIKEFQVEELFK